jgi:hypothetical protein
MQTLSRRALLVFAVLSVAGASQSLAQKEKPVMLQLRPRIGDTISMRLDQQTELFGKREGTRASTASMMSTTITYSRAVIESGVASATTIVAITDSVLMSSSNEPSKGPAPPMQRQYPNQRVRLHLAPNGSISTSPDASSATKGIARSASLIPATFPTTPVAVGERWTREAPLPAGTSQLGNTIVGWVQATFRLDSLTHGGNLAWVSMHGTLTPDSTSRRADGVATVDDGMVDGYMVIDRDRGWLTESKFHIVAHSSLRQPFGLTGQPMSFEIRLVQTLKTLK